jgi:hypothetical protein
MPSAKFEQDTLWFQRGGENLKGEVAVLEAQLAELEQKNLRSPILLQKLGEYFGFGAAGKLGWARFKLSFKREQLERFEAQPGALKVTIEDGNPVISSRLRQLTRDSKADSDQGGRPLDIVVYKTLSGEPND